MASQLSYADAKNGKILNRIIKGKKRDLAPVGSKIPDGPLTRGFDYFHGFHHAGDMKGVIENDEVILHEEEVNMLPRITRKSVEYIEARTDESQPFFLYVPYGSPHAPIVPTAKWQGKSGLGKYADFVMETDGGFGEILDAIDRTGFSENTIVIFTSDNGCSKVAKIPQLREQGIMLARIIEAQKLTYGMVAIVSHSSCAGPERLSLVRDPISSSATPICSLLALRYLSLIFQKPQRKIA